MWKGVFHLYTHTHTHIEKEIYWIQLRNWSHSSLARHASKSCVFVCVCVRYIYICIIDDGWILNSFIVRQFTTREVTTKNCNHFIMYTHTHTQTHIHSLLILWWFWVLVLWCVRHQFTPNRIYVWMWVWECVETNQHELVLIIINLIDIST